MFYISIAVSSGFAIHATKGVSFKGKSQIDKKTFLHCLKTHRIDMDQNTYFNDIFRKQIRHY